MKYADLTVYTADSMSLLFETDGVDRISVVAEGSSNLATGRAAERASTSMSLRDAIKARRALRRTIRVLKSRSPL